MARDTHTREVYLAFHHIKTARYGIPIWDAIPDSEKTDLPENAKARVMFGLYVHDISKLVQLGWTDELLSRDKHPTPKEWENVIVPHPDKAREILEAAGIEDEIVLDVANYHHTREDDKWFQGVTPDGSTEPKYAGYPLGVIGSKFPFHTTFGKSPDAISSMEEERPYRERKHTPASIFKDIIKRSGTEYKKIVVDAFRSLPEYVRKGVFEHDIHSGEAARNIESRMIILQAAACNLGYLRKDAVVKNGNLDRLVEPGSVQGCAEKGIVVVDAITPASTLTPEEFNGMLKKFSDFYDL